MQLRGLVDTVRLGRVPARTLAIADSRSLVRSMFLASAVRIDILSYLRAGRRFDEISSHTGCTRPERLQAWLWIGSELGELSFRGDHYGVRGHRARALADGDRLLIAHYRSMLDYQIGPYGELDELLHSDVGDGRGDLYRFADDIAQVSLAAAPFVASFVRRSVAEVRPLNVLDVGCGTGVYSKVVLDADRYAYLEGIDLSEDVIEAARDELKRAGFTSRFRLHVGDVRHWVRESPTQFDLILLLNNIYYFQPESRTALYRELRELLTDRGQLLIVSMMAPGSIAAAHLHFMLSCQDTTASLPRQAEIENDLLNSGFRILANQVLVPTEPFVGLSAARR
jgi:SAM-dependent methyltransferase